MDNKKGSKSKDSTTFVLQTGIDRKPTSYRLDRSLSQWFKQVCRKQGLSTCHVIEAYQYAHCIAYENEGVRIEQRPININLKVERIVSKIRRRSKLSFSEDIEIIEFGDLNECARCGSPYVTKRVHHFENPIRYVRRYVCLDCFKFLRNNNEVESWKDL